MVRHYGIISILSLMGLLASAPAMASGNLTEIPADGKVVADTTLRGNKVIDGDISLAPDPAVPGSKAGLWLKGSQVSTSGNIHVNDQNLIMEGSTLNAYGKTIGVGTNGVLDVTNGSVLNAGTVDLSAGATFQVLQSLANINTLKLATGSTMFLDPATVTIGNGTEVVSGSMQVGKRSVLSWGSYSADWLSPVIARTGVKGSVLGLQHSLNLGSTGSVLVNNATQPATTTPHGVNFDANSMLVLDTAAMASYNPNTWHQTGAIQVGTGAKVNIDPTSTLYILFPSDDIYFIGDEVVEISIIKGDPTSGFTADSSGYWQNRVFTNSYLLDASMKYNQAQGDISAVLKTVSADEITRRMPGLSHDLANIMRAIIMDPNASDNVTAGAAYLVLAADNSKFSGKQAAANISAVTSLASAGGAQAVLLETMGLVGDVITTRAGFFSNQSGIGAGSDTGTGLSVWGSPIYQNQKFKNAKSNGLKTGYVSNGGGMLVGMDYTVDNTWRVGGALNVGSGTARSTGDSSSVRNNYTFWGLSAYAGYNMNNLHVSADLGYERNSNNLNMNNTGVTIASRSISADAKGVDTEALSVGINVAYTVPTAMVDVTPHAGVRYTNLRTENYTVKANNRVDMFEVHTKTQNIISIPIGVTFDKVIAHPSGWLFKPGVDLGMTFNTGGLKANSKAYVANYGTAGLKTPITEAVVFDGGLSFSATKDDFSVGLNYNLQLGKNTTNHAVSATMRVAF